MTALTKFACTLILAGGLAAPAFAATTGAPSPGSTGDSSTNGQSAMSHDQTRMNNGPMTNNQGAMANDQTTMHPGQKLRADLTKAGYTDIKIMPSSFIVHAKDSDGNPVMMVISPDSVTAITEENAGANSASNSRHLGATSDSAGATPGPASTEGSQPVTPGSKP